MINFELIHNNWWLFMRGAAISLQIAALGCAIGFSLGTLIGFAQTYGNKAARIITTLYVTIIRGTPMLVQIAFVYFVLPQFGISLGAFWSAVIAIGFNSAAYISQVIRTGISAVGKGQLEAARVLGLSELQTMRYIVLPQAVRVVLPALGNEFVTLIKDSSLASTIGVMELSKEGAFVISRTYDAISVYCAIAAIYLVMTTTLSLLVNKLEQRMGQHAQH